MNYRYILKFCFVLCLVICFSTSNVIAQCSPLVTTVSSTSVCDGDQVTLSAVSQNLGNITWDNGVTSNVAFTPAVGTITYTATSDNVNDCQFDIDITVNPLDDPSFQYLNGLIYCATGADPVGIVTGSAGGIFSFTVNFGGPNLIINAVNGNVDLVNSNSGSYDITYTTNGVCPQTSTLTLAIIDAPIANFSFFEYCANDTDPMPDFVYDDQGVPFPQMGSGGMFSEPTGLLSINAATGQVDLGFSTPGTYTVTNTINIVGCAVVTYDDDITINPIPDVTFTVQDEIFGNDGAVTLIINSGTAPYEFNWSNGAITEDLTGLSGGTYTVFITDANGCVSSNSATVNTQLGIEESGFASLFVFPIPTINNLTIQMNSIYTYELINCIGDILISGTGVNSTDLSLSELSEGIYLLNILSNGKQTTLKIIKQ